MKEVKIYIAVKKNVWGSEILRTAEKRELIIEFIENDIQNHIKNLYGRNNVEVLKGEERYILLDRDTNEALCRWMFSTINHIVEGKKEENVECQEVKEVKE